ncbi:unnamed protein product [Adineta steineri]|uniref:Uncharacterized protein n=1 Tax=Adineta steineri TaxID=433720 RepID=A0A814B7T2_9BILA|nr:unnamed protein product [Adineta steineri]CAF0765884.1 unnamed protein product [Adineta steineri]CAF0923118.1 unnamed protein product [Adineta steineri]
MKVPTISSDFESIPVPIPTNSNSRIGIGIGACLFKFNLDNTMSYHYLFPNITKLTIDADNKWSIECAAHLYQ